ncbi:hypothetical protein E2C01_072918 [Portunus trituberculatus]|uniref:Uncharacterized protein n=1 Tax=Portunus trituberculatus TaxID=210409 RepID=A0A5B7I3V0_PORTR|nr:hypothetical protein [Portunus trituberculatus]
MRSTASLRRRKQSSGRNTSSTYSQTSPNSVFSILPFTCLAFSGSLSSLSLAVMIASPRHSEGNIHCRHTSEVKRLECHLSARFPDALGTQGTHRCARLHHSSLVAVQARIEEVDELCEALNSAESSLKASSDRYLVASCRISAPVKGSSSGKGLLARIWSRTLSKSMGPVVPSISEGSRPSPPYLNCLGYVRLG